MKRPRGAALAAALMSLYLLYPAARPVAAGSLQLPPNIPNLVRPELFEGFEPFPPDEFGFSPDFEFFIFQDEQGLQVVRLDDGTLVFRQRLTDDVEIGFNLEDSRMYLLDGPHDTPRFRFIEPNSGAVLLERRLRARPEIRTDLTGFVNLLVVRNGPRADIQIFDGDGLPTQRLDTSAGVQWGINLAEPLVAFVDAEPFAGTKIDVINVETRRFTFRERTDQLVEAGFELFGPAFVIGQPAARNQFRVLLANGLTGRRLLKRVFPGPLDFGFIPDTGFGTAAAGTPGAGSALLGVVEDGARQQRLLLFRTVNGRQVFGLRNPGT